MTEVLPTERAASYAAEIHRLLETSGFVDYEGDCRITTDYLWESSGGQMLGVLVCVNERGEEVVLKAFSGQINGNFIIDGWAPPACDAVQYAEIANTGDQAIVAISGQIDLAERSGDTLAVQALRRQRKEISQDIQRQIFALYQFYTIDGSVVTLSDIFKDQMPPTGTGDCCAPKLLNQAFSQNLTPLSMLEWYYGAASESQPYQHGSSYPPCDTRCRPLLAAMLQLDIIYRDDDIVVVNKPSGLLSVPGRGPDKQDCVVSRVRRLYPFCIAQPSVHRLDMDTSGLLVLAFNQKAHRDLSKQFIERTVKKEYIALVDGIVMETEGTIELAFRYDPDQKPRQKYDPVLGKRGNTHWERIRVEPFGDTKRLVTRIRFQPTTGRTHQLRLHSMHERGLGFPILGDPLYGSAQSAKRLMLHANEISFAHPSSGKRMQFTLDPDF